LWLLLVKRVLLRIANSLPSANQPKEIRGVLFVEMKTTLAESDLLLSNALQTALSLLSKEKMRETLREL
jgi:hypothetical protein